MNCLSCPRCRSEFVEGVETCPECGVSLVVSLPPIEEPGDALEPVLQTNDPGLLQIVKSTLEAAGVPHLVQGEGGMGLFPLGPFSPGLFRRGLGATVLVPADRLPEARALLEGVDPDEPPVADES